MRRMVERTRLWLVRSEEDKLKSADSTLKDLEPQANIILEALMDGFGYIECHSSV